MDIQGFVFLIYKIIPDEIFVDTGICTEFTDGNKLVFLFAECFANVLYKSPGRTVLAAGDVFNVLGINNDPWWNGFRDWHKKENNDASRAGSKSLCTAY